MFLHPRRNVRIAGIRFFVKQTDDAHDHAGRAVSALKSALSEEGFLDRMKFVTFRKTFYGDNGVFVCIGYRGEAGRNTFPVEKNGAGTALAFAAAVFCAGELEIFTKDIEERAFGISGDGVGMSVDGEFESRIHRRFGQCVALVCNYTQDRNDRQQGHDTGCDWSHGQFWGSQKKRQRTAALQDASAPS